LSKISSFILTSRLKEYAKSIGFQDVGISKSKSLEKEALELEKWLRNGFQGEMSYMERNFDLRIHPQKLHENTKSIISLSYNYFKEESQEDDLEQIKISKYARGRDYHKVLKRKLKLIIDWLKKEVGDVSARGFVDSAPVMERVWAEKSGLGWVGKNSLLLTKGVGSYFFLAEIFVDIELEYDHSVKNYCGTCTKCIDACPTQAIVAPYVVDSKKCISYLTIEYKGNQLPAHYSENSQNWIYGCDICQDVCPINARARQHVEPDFKDKEIFSNMTRSIWENMTEEKFNEVFHDSPIKRTGYKGLMRNLEFSKQVKS
jgi:epoxyqueuosine reductase